MFLRGFRVAAFKLSLKNAIDVQAILVTAFIWKINESKNYFTSSPKKINCMNIIGN